MGFWDYIAQAFKEIATLTGIIYIIGGTIAGIVLGAIPGLGSSTLLVILLPIAYKIDTNLVLALFMAVVIGGMSGGCIGSILLGIPGTSSSLCTVWDGYAMTQKGDPVRPLSAAVTANFIGNVPGVIIAIFACGAIGTWAVKLGPWEYAALCFCAILMVVGLSKENLAKGMLGVGLAIFLASIGEDPITAHGRFLFFNRLEFLDGFNLISLMLGLFAAKIILVEYARASKASEQVDIKVGGYKWPGKDLKDNKWLVIRSWFLGVFIGFLPGLGGPVAAGLAYSTEKMLSKEKDQWGKGHIGGVLATETANNAAIGGALIPFLSLGIPGDAANVQFIAALNVKGINVGPMFMREQTLIVYIIFMAALLSGIVAMLYETLGMKTFPALLKIPYHYLYSLIAILTLTGAYMATGSFFGLIVMLVSCIIGVLMDVFGIPSLPFLMAFILSPLLELNIRRGFNYSPRGLAEFFLRPISCAFIVVGLIVLIWGMVGPVIRKALKKDKTDSTANTGC